MVAPLDGGESDIPGLCGIVPESILPQFFGLEAGQSAVGDIFNWFVKEIQPGGQSHEQLTADAEKMRPGQSGLLALDWHNGNRTILVDQRLTGGIIGLNLQTTAGEMYRSWIEATAFGARVIMERFEEYGQTVERIVNCGGISVKNPLVMQIYADIMGRPIAISRSAQTAALGASIAAAVAGGVFDSFDEATQKMTGLLPITFEPNAENQALYNRLYVLYHRLHDAFGAQKHARRFIGRDEAIIESARRGARCRITHFAALQQEVYEANMRLMRAGLVVLTWGNVSGIDRERGVIAIKPSGVAYDTLKAADIVLVSLESGQPLEGQTLRPSSDTPTHVCFVSAFPKHWRHRAHAFAPRDELGAGLPRNSLLWHHARRYLSWPDSPVSHADQRRNQRRLRMEYRRCCGRSFCRKRSRSVSRAGRFAVASRALRVGRERR